MPAKLRAHLSYANVVSSLCLFMLLGGSAYAVTRIDANSVKSRHIVNGQVRQADLGPGAVSADKIRAGVLGATWREVGPAGITDFTPPDLCDWGNASDVTNSTAFSRDVTGFVHLKGRVQAEDVASNPIDCDVAAFEGGDVRTVFMLPAGYRPARVEENLSLTNNGVRGTVNLFPDGRVMVDWSGGDLPSQWTFDGITFRCAPSAQAGCP